MKPSFSSDFWIVTWSASSKYEAVSAREPSTGRWTAGGGKLGTATGTTPFVRGVEDQGSEAGESKDGAERWGLVRRGGGVSYEGGASWGGEEKWSVWRAAGEDSRAMLWEAEGAEGAGCESRGVVLVVAVVVVEVL
jgi:hypothetical protein